jgi:hypothetical protein
LSGRGYVFTVYPFAECPAFSDAVLLVVKRELTGNRGILAALDTGAFPEPVLARAAHQICADNQFLEFHIHLLARSLAERKAVLTDLSGALG